MNKRNISLSKILISTLLFSHSVLGAPSTEAQVSIGTYKLQNYWNQAIILTNNNDGSWQFQEAPWGQQLAGNLIQMSCIDKTCIATAYTMKEIDNHYESSLPMFVMSNDHGLTWYVNQNISMLPEMRTGFAGSISCTSKVCIAGGTYTSGSHALVPMLLSSYDNGQSWSNIQNLPIRKDKNGGVTALTCTDNSCIASVNYDSAVDYGEAYLGMWLSQDKGQSWAGASIAGLPDKTTKIRVNYIKCYDKNCVAAGQYDTSTIGFAEHLLLLVSQNEGKSWTFVKELPALAHMKYLLMHDLIYANGSFLVVGGYANDNATPLKSVILVGRNNGTSWSLINRMSDAPSGKLRATLNTVSCTHSTCIAGGDNDEGLNFLISKDNGASWSLITDIPAMNAIPTIDKLHCMGNSCTAFGNYYENGSSHPLVMISHNKGESWSINDRIVNFPENVQAVHFADVK